MVAEKQSSLCCHQLETADSKSAWQENVRHNSHDTLGGLLGTWQQDRYIILISEGLRTERTRSVHTCPDQRPPPWQEVVTKLIPQNNKHEAGPCDYPGTGCGTWSCRILQKQFWHLKANTVAGAGNDLLVYRPDPSTSSLAFPLPEYSAALGLQSSILLHWLTGRRQWVMHTDKRLLLYEA